MLQYTIAIPGSSQVAALVTNSTSVRPVAGISSCSFKIFPQISQWVPSVFPDVSQVGDINSDDRWDCKRAGVYYRVRNKY